jgi:hypothetical protein
MSVDLQESPQLSALLEQIAELRADKEKAETEVKAIGKRLRDLESLAVEQLALSGLDGVRAAGKSWYLREFFGVSIPEEHKEAVVAAARAACPEYIAVNTSSLKSWLMERRRNIEGEAPAGLADGTPFAGLISEYREVRLSHRTLG